MTNTIYIHQPEKSVSFTRLPNFLFEAPTFTPLSNEAKILYAFILRRTELSRKNGWADEYGRIYLYYPICEVVALLHCGRQKAVNYQQSPPSRRTTQVRTVCSTAASAGHRKKPISRLIRLPCLGVTDIRLNVTASGRSAWSVKPPNSSESTGTRWKN